MLSDRRLNFDYKKIIEFLIRKSKITTKFLITNSKITTEFLITNSKIIVKFLIRKSKMIFLVLVVIGVVFFDMFPCSFRF